MGIAITENGKRILAKCLLWLEELIPLAKETFQDGDQTFARELNFHIDATLRIALLISAPELSDLATSIGGHWGPELIEIAKILTLDGPRRLTLSLDPNQGTYLVLDRIGDEVEVSLGIGSASLIDEEEVDELVYKISELLKTRVEIVEI